MTSLSCLWKISYRTFVHVISPTASKYTQSNGNHLSRLLNCQHRSCAGKPASPSLSIVEQKRRRVARGIWVPTRALLALTPHIIISFTSTCSQVYLCPNMKLTRTSTYILRHRFIHKVMFTVQLRCFHQTRWNLFVRSCCSFTVRSPIGSAESTCGTAHQHPIYAMATCQLFTRPSG